MSRGLDKLFETAFTPVAEEPVQFSSPAVTVSIPPEGCRDLPIDALVDMEQPFHLYGPGELETMRQSICGHGVIQRLIVRPYGDGVYQIISGRNRRTAARMAGYTAVPCEIRHLNDDEAELQMLETNLRQRDRLLPSERAWAYRLQLEALKRQGQRADLTSPQSAAKSRSDDELGQESGVSGDTIRRYVRLSYLISPLLEAVDAKTLGFGGGVSLSYLTSASQESVYNYFFSTHPRPIDQHLADRLRAAGEVSELTEAELEALLSGQMEKPQAVKTIPFSPLKKYFPRNAPKAAIEKTVAAALKLYFEAGNRMIEK